MEVLTTVLCLPSVLTSYTMHENTNGTDIQKNVKMIICEEIIAQY